MRLGLGCGFPKSAGSKGKYKYIDHHQAVASNKKSYQLALSRSSIISNCLVLLGLGVLAGGGLAVGLRRW
jgi:hypothetical protein